MNKETLLWTLLILSWLTTFFMNKREMKRLMPAALFTAVTSGIIIQGGYAAKIWLFKEQAAPLLSYGPLAVTALWILRFTYGRFWLYMLVNAILDLVFAFVIMPWLVRAEIFGAQPWSYISIYFITVIHSTLIYGFQKWQESIFTRSNRSKS